MKTTYELSYWLWQRASSLNEWSNKPRTSETYLNLSPKTFPPSSVFSLPKLTRESPAYDYSENPFIHLDIVS